MSQNFNPTPTNAFDTLGTGRGTSSAFLTVFETRAPTASDVSYPIQKRWINIDNGFEYYLESFTNSTGVLQANWLALNLTDTVTLTGNTGGTVSPDGSHNINVVGDGTTINVVGDPATHTLTISSASGISTSFHGNSGTATPSAGVLNITGTGGVLTSGSGNTISIEYTPTGFVQFLAGNSGGNVGPTVGGVVNVVGDTTTINVSGNPGTETLTISTAGHVATTYTEDSGTAVPSSGGISIVGGTGISTSGSGHTITITNTSSESITFAEDSGTATPSAGTINVFGGTGISTIGSGNTVTIAASASLATSYVTNSGTAVPFSNSLTVIGEDGVTTSGSGNIITISSSGSGVQVIRQVFTTSGTYTPTSGMQYCDIECLGGGGAGGGPPGSTAPSCGGGGGAGEFASGIFTAAEIGSSQTITIGAGGTGVLGTTGNSGGATSVGSLISAFGGLGGPSIGSSGSAAGIVGGLGGTGGSGGSLHAPGGAGSFGLTSNPGGFAFSGYGATSQFGEGGVGTFSGLGGNGLGYGAGGGGSEQTGGGPPLVGANGSPGIVVITEYIGTTAAGSLQFSGNSGTALPSANNINIIGGTNITTSASGSTVTINNGIAFSKGSFSPGISFGGASVGVNYSAQSGSYTILGNILYYQLSFILTSKGSSTGIAEITGLPFNSAGANVLSGSPQLGTVTFSGNFVSILSESGTTKLLIEQVTSGMGYTSLDNTNFANTSSVSVSGFYFLS